MNGQTEDVKIAENGEVVVINRGTKGAAVINFSGNVNEVSLATNLLDGDYTDKVYGQPFNVKDGILTATVQPHTTYIISL